MKLQQLVIAALTLGSAGAFAAANPSSSTDIQPQGQGYNSPYASQANVSSKQPASQQGSAAQGDVSQLQQALNDKGYNAGPVDGKLGPKTRSALKQFQQSQGLPATGQADSQTVAMLNGANGSQSASQSTPQDQPSSAPGTNGSQAGSSMSSTNGSTASSTTNGTNGATSSSPRTNGTNGSTSSAPQGNNNVGNSSPPTGDNSRNQQSGTGRSSDQG